MWEKLAWDVDVFTDTQMGMPKERQPLAFAAINSCLAADSLGYWVLKSWKRERRARGQKAADAEFFELLNLKVPAQHICSAIANTSKHYDFHEGSWIGGSVALRFQAGDEDWPSGLELLYQHNGKWEHASVLLNGLVRDWWAFMRELGLAEGEQPLPDWLQRKLTRMFGAPFSYRPPGEG